MSLPDVVYGPDSLAARNELLVLEKQAARRAGRAERGTPQAADRGDRQGCVFEAPGGKASLADLFEGHP